MFLLQHEEMVLLLIQLRRSQSRLEDARNWYRSQMEFSRVGEREYKRQYVCTFVGFVAFEDTECSVFCQTFPCLWIPIVSSFVAPTCQSIGACILISLRRPFALPPWTQEILRQVGHTYLPRAHTDFVSGWAKVGL